MILFIILVVILKGFFRKHKFMETELKVENYISKIVEVGYCTGYCMSSMLFAPNFSKFPAPHKVKSRLNFKIAAKTMRLPRD